MDLSFADALDPTAITGAAPAPSKFGGFADALGNVVAAVGGHPVDTESAYQTGRLHSAQTEGALAQARERRAKALDEERITTARAHYADAAVAAGVPRSIVDNITAGYNPQQMTGAQENLQKMDFADRIANPTSPTVASNARAALAPGSYNRYYNAGNGLLADNASATDPSLTDVGQATIDNLHEPNSAAAAGGAGAPLLRTSNGVAYQSLDHGATWTPITSSGEAASRAAELAAARAAGSATGQKQAALTGNLNNYDAFAKNIDDLLAAPGFDTIYGASSILDPRNFVRGTDAASAQTLRDQLGSRSFLASIQSMRGMGSLSNAEGAKVETAMTRALQPGLNETDARAAFAELRTALANLRAVAVSEAAQVPSVIPGQNGAPAPAPGQTTFATEAEAQAAEAAGTLQKGTRVTIGGVAGTWQ